jgi:cation diffusion facilitator family transporter
VILVSAVQRFITPAPLERIGIGLAISAAATALNAAVGMLLIRVGRRRRSATLAADGKHLMTDVWTSAGVLVGVLLVGVTGWQRLDPAVAALVGLNILVAGGSMVAQSVRALLDEALDEADLAKVISVLDRFRGAEVDFHGLQTRQSGQHRFVSMHVLVPGEWSVQHGHDLVEQVEEQIRTELPDSTVFTHMEPREDPRAYDDYAYDGHDNRPAPTDSGQQPPGQGDA